MAANWGINPWVRQSRRTDLRVRRAFNFFRSQNLDRLEVNGTFDKFNEPIFVWANTSGSVNASIKIASYGTGIPALVTDSSNGTRGAQTAKTSSEVLSRWAVAAHDGTSMNTVGGITFTATENHTPSARGTRVDILGNTAGSGSNSIFLALEDGVATTFKRRWTRESQGTSFTAAEGTYYSCTAGGITATLPPLVDGMEILISDEDASAGASAITIDGDSAETINGLASITISTNYQAVLLIANATEWNAWYLEPTARRPLIALGSYESEPAKNSESNHHGGLLALATAQPLNSVPTNIVVTKGIGKVLVMANAGSDVVGDITVTGTSVDRETGAETGADTDTLSVTATSVDNSDTDGNGNTRHAFTQGYITSKWFRGTVTLSTTNLTLTDVDVYHVSFDQVNDTAVYDIECLDINLFTTNTSAEFDAYLYALEVTTGDRCNVSRIASANVGTNGNTALANRYERLRRGNIDKNMDGSTDGLFLDIFYSNSPTYVEDVTIKVWVAER